MSQIVLASGNPGKIREIQAILLNNQILPQSQFQVTEPDETGTTFVENAIIKARNAARRCQMPAIADDSGLVVDALHGAPGVVSARYAGNSATDQANIDKLLAAMRGIADIERSARFICVMVYLRHYEDPTPLIAQGVWEGRILHHAIGGNGFGYDPVFWLDDQQCSSAQLAPELKNAISHRSLALRALTRQIAALREANSA
ncbi:MAG: RdgB/HAM1 family non-canonical purine NTP pyrophosphatase [Methylomonas sp.]|jgi:XTP/dITP diphosphohydrolase